MISVILPIYNTKNYLRQCVDSILSQTYKNWELIAVDDGSTDGSDLLIDEFENSDKRIKVIHKQNGGLSDARNVGVSLAKGEWIYFADSDDWLDAAALETLMRFAEKTNCDVVQGNIYYSFPDHCLYRNSSSEERKKCVIPGKEAMRLLIINDRIKNFAWGKLYKKDLIENLPFRVGKYFEDSFWQHLVMDRVKRYGIIDTPLYFYRQRPDSISGSHSEKFKDLIAGYKERLDFINDKYPQYSKLMKKKYKEIYNQINKGNSLKYKMGFFVKRIYQTLFTRKKYIVIRK